MIAAYFGAQRWSLRYMIRKYPCPKVEKGLSCGDQNCVPCAENMAYETGCQACLASAWNVLTTKQSILLQGASINQVAIRQISAVISAPSLLDVAALASEPI
jgi:hypothetical protein